MIDQWSIDNYPYRGVELKPHMLCELAERNFSPGSVMQRKWLVEDAPIIHLELGGISTSVNPISQAKKARTTLLSGDWEEAGYGSIRRLGGSAAPTDAENGELSSEACIVESTLTADEWVGTGDETVYCYTFPSLVELAALKGQARMPIKIGKTSFPTLDRVSLQCGVSNPEQPVVLLAIRVDSSSLYERAIHKVLTIWNRWIDEAPGTEWFKTSRDEILTIVSFLNNSPAEDECLPNNGVEADA